MFFMYFFTKLSDTKKSLDFFFQYINVSVYIYNNNYCNELLIVLIIYGTLYYYNGHNDYLKTLRVKPCSYLFLTCIGPHQSINVDISLCNISTVQLKTEKMHG